MKNSTVLLAFLGGVALGAVAGLLLAPDKGAETRKKLLEALEKSGVSLNKEEWSELLSQWLGQSSGESSPSGENA